MEDNILKPEKNVYELMLEYTMRFRKHTNNEIVESGTLTLFAKQIALKKTIDEFVEENPDVDKKSICNVFYLIGDLSHNMIIDKPLRYNPGNMKDFLQETNENKIDKNK